MKRILSILLIVVLAFSLGACSAGSKDMTVEEIIGDATKNSTKWKNFDADIDIEMEMILYGEEATKFSISGDSTFYLEPQLRMKMMLETAMGEDMTAAIAQYMVQEDEMFITYQNIKGQWYKTTLEDQSLSGIMTIDPAENMELFLKHLKAAEIVAEEKVSGKDTYKIDLTVSFDMYKELIQKNASLDFGGVNNMGILETLSDAEDLKYTIWIEKKTLMPIKYYMDFSDVMSKIGTVLATQQNMPEDVAKAYENMKMVMVMEFKNVNKATAFEIPQEAIDAKERDFINN